MKKHLLKFLLTFIIALSVGWVNGQTTIYSQSFETDLDGYSHTPSQTPATDPGDQYFHRAEPSETAIYESSSTQLYTNVTDSWLFVGSNPNTINGGNPGILTFDPITVTGYTNLEFHADFGACPNDWDDTDTLKVKYNFDGGAWQTLYYFDNLLDGTNDTLVVAGNPVGGINTANGTKLTFDLTTISSDNFVGSGDILNIIIYCNSNANFEAFGVDNIEVIGTLSNTAPQATWTPANSATLVEPDANITIEFDEKIFKSDGTTEIVDGDLSALITLKETNASGADVAFSATYNNTNFTITIDPTSNLSYNSVYYVAFGSVYDNTQLENTGETITFTTKPDTDKDSKISAPVTQVAAATVESTVTDSIAVFSFTVSDLGTADGLATSITQITLIGGPNHTFALDEGLAGGYIISEGNISIPLGGEPTIIADTITIPFAANTFNIPDGEDSTYTVYFVLDTIQVDGSVIQLMIDADNHGFVADATGSEFAADFTTDVVGNDITINVTASKLQFTEQPTSTYVGNNLPEVKVTATDLNGNTDIDYVTNISITATGATLNNSPVAVTPVSGVSAYSTLSFSDEGNGVTLTAASGALTNGVSDAFNSFGDDLFFSEYIEGGGNNKALEIYNGTGSDVDLANYVIRVNYNGNEWNEVFDFPIGTNIANGEVYVIAHADADAEIIAETDSAVVNPYSEGTSYVVAFNGDDVRALCKVNGTDTTIIDIIGKYDLVDPGSGWDVAGTSSATNDHTIIRKTGKTTGNTDWTNSAGTTEGNSEWIVMPKDYSNNLGAYRDINNDTTLSDLTVDATTVTGFASDTYLYDIELAYGTSVVPTVAGTATDATYARVDVVQAPNVSDTAVVTVTADNLGTKEYKIAFSVAENTENDITSFIFEALDPDVTGVLDAGAHTVTATVPYGTVVTALVPTIVVSDSATISPATGIAQNFTNPVNYTVTAEDGTAQIWSVTVVVEENTENDITSFIFEALDPDVAGVLDAGAHTVTATVPYGTDVTALVPTIAISGDATVSPVSGAAQDFTNPVDYTVTAQDLTNQIWTVTVSIASTDAKELTSFSIVDPAVTGVITEADHTIAIEVPYGTNVTALVSNFATTGKEVKVGTSVQVSGTTPNNFTSPVTYTVVAADDTEQNYIVTVTITAANTDATLSNLTTALGTLDPNFAAATLTYNVDLPAGTTETPLVTPSTTDANANAVVTPATDVTSATEADRTTTVVVTAENGTTTKTYSVIFAVEEPAGDLFFSEYIEGDGGNNKALEIYNSTGANVDLHNYIIRSNSNGSAWTSYMDFPVGTTLSNGDVYVIAHAEAIAEILAVTDTAVVNPYSGGSCYVAIFNGNDARALCKVEGTDTTIIDVIGEESVDSAWSVAGIDGATKNHTLLRKSGTTIGNANWTLSAGTNTTDSEWEVKDANYFDDLGSYGLKSGTDILTFSFTEQTGAATIDATAHTVAIEVALGTSPAALVATFTLSSGASAKVGVTDQVSATTANDFTLPVTYTVTAEDASTQDWVVTVTVSTTQSSANAVTSCTVEGVAGTIGDGTVTATLPYGTDITNLKPVFVISALATIADTAAARDFTTPQTYVVTAEDGTAKNWLVTITAETATEVDNIAALRALYSKSDKAGLVFKLTGEVTLTYATAPNYYIQDATAAILIYDNSTITTTYDIGDNIQNIVGTFDTFGGNMQFKLEEDPGTAVSTGNTITAQAVTITELTSNYVNYDAELIKLENVTFTETGAFAAGSNYTLNNGSDQIALRTNFSGADYIGTDIPTEAYDITAIAGIYNGTPQVYPRSLTDFVLVTGIGNDFVLNSIKLYPNPSNGLFTLELNNSNNEEFIVEIYNVIGKIVYTAKISDNLTDINITKMSAGIYYVSINNGENRKVSRIMIQ